MRAALAMYDLPAVRAATDAWWAGLARHLAAAGVDGVPPRLAREPAPDPGEADVLLAQTCGYPLTHRLAGRVRLVCTPCYDAPGCEGPRYSSVLLVPARSSAQRLADLRGGVCAINQRDSHSGCNALRRLVAPLAEGRPFFERVVETGAHVASIAAIGSGAADLCAVDAVTHALLARHDSESLAGTRVLGFTRGAPGLPWVTAAASAPDLRERLQAGIRKALDDPALAPVRAELLLAGAEPLPLAAYDEIVAMERAAVALGYPELR